MNEKFIILADATCDLTDDLREQFDIEAVHGTITFPDGSEESSFLNWQECKHYPSENEEPFYKALKKDPAGFKTAPPGIQVMHDKIQEYVSQGYGVLGITISSALSGTYGFMEAAVKQIKEEYPQAEVYCIDSKRYGSAMGLLAIYASEARREGKSLKETYDYIESIKMRLHQSGLIDDLSFVAKKGRMSNAKAFFGTLIGIKPIGELDAAGMTTVIGKVKGAKTAYNVILDYMEEIGEDLSNQIILVAQSLRREQAEDYKKRIEERFHPRAVYLTTVFPLDGVNMGPGLVAAYYLGSPVTEGLENERAALNKVIEKNSK